MAVKTKNYIKLNYNYFFIFIICSKSHYLCLSYFLLFFAFYISSFLNLCFAYFRYFRLSLDISKHKKMLNFILVSQICFLIRLFCKVFCFLVVKTSDFKYVSICKNTYTQLTNNNLPGKIKTWLNQTMEWQIKFLIKSELYPLLTAPMGKKCGVLYGLPTTMYKKTK